MSGPVVTTTAVTMVATLEAALAKNAGVVEVVVDGQKVRWDRAQALAELKYWRNRVARSTGRRPLFRGMDLSGGAA